MAIVRIVGIDETPDAHLPARYTHDNLVIQRQWGARHRVSLHGVGHALLPEHASATGIQCNQVVVQRYDEDAAAEDGNTAVEGIDLEWIYPPLLAVKPPDWQPAA